jgi:recX family
VPDESFDRSFGARDGATSFEGAEGGNPAPRAPSPELVESVLDELEGMKLLSDRRMAESLVRNGAERFGRARLSQDLQRKGLDENLISNVLQPLTEDEKSRAQAVWQRRFGKPPTSLKEKARQYRFLVGRGFAPGIVSAVVPRIVDAPDEDDDSSAFDAGF